MAKNGSPKVELEQVLALKTCPDVGTDALRASYDLAYPSRSLAEWRGYLTTLLYSLGALLSIWGLSVCVNYYWPEMSDEQRCGVFALSTLLSFLIAGRHGRRSVPGKVALGSASVLIGCLIYVADDAYNLAEAYQLLALWSSCVFPLAVAAQFAPLWLFTIGLLNVTLNALCDEFMGGWLRRHGPFLASLLFNLGLLTIWEIGTSRGRRWLGRKIFPPILSLIALTPLTLSLGAQLADPHTSLARLTVPLVTIAATWFVLFSYFTVVRRDSGVLATQFGSMIFVCSGYLARHIFVTERHFNYLLFASLVVMQITFALGLLRKLSRKSGESSEGATSVVPATRKWLAGLATDGHITSEQIESLEEFLAQRNYVTSNLFAQIFSTVGATLAAVSLWIYLVVSGYVSQVNGVQAGLVICVLACVMTWLRRASFSNLSLTLGLCGQWTVLVGLIWEKVEHPEFCLAMAGLQLGFVLLYQENIGRFLSVNFAGISVWSWLISEAPAPALEGMVILVAAMLSYLWLRQKSLVLGLMGRAHNPVAMGLATLLLGLLSTTLDSQPAPLIGISSAIGLVAITLATSRVLKSNFWALLVLMIFGILTATDPGIIASVLICQLAFSRRQFRLQILGLISLLTFGIAFFNGWGFYELEKSAALLGTGLAFLLLAKWAESLSHQEECENRPEDAE